MRLSLLLTLASFACIGNASAEDFFGKFEGEPQGRFIRGGDRPLFELSADFKFIDPNGLEWVAPAGQKVDGASIPPWAWSIVGGPFSGNFLNAAIVHDYFCCARNRDYFDTHRTFWRGARAEGVSWFKANVMWAAIRSFGPPHWIVDPNREPPVPCESANSVLANASMRANGIAATKLIAIARTLESTNDAVLDVVDGKVVLAGSAEAEELFDRLQRAALKEFEGPVEQFGLFSRLEAGEYRESLGMVSGQVALVPWDVEEVPELVDYYPDEARARYQELIASGWTKPVVFYEYPDQSAWQTTVNVLAGDNDIKP